MRRIVPAIILLVAATFAAAAPAHAVGTFDLSWHACSPVTASTGRGDARPIDLFATVIGQEEGHKSYGFRLWVSSPRQVLPDAWRFDSAGCQGSSRIRMDVPAKTACPAFGPASPFEIKDFVFSSMTGVASLDFTKAYPPGVVAPDPLVRYLLLRVTFDHTASVLGTSGVPAGSCGGFDQDVVISLVRPFCSSPGGCGGANPPLWVDMQGETRTFAVGQGMALFCGPCDAVPAEAATWGAIKGQYRR